MGGAGRWRSSIWHSSKSPPFQWPAKDDGWVEIPNSLPSFFGQ